MIRPGIPGISKEIRYDNATTSTLGKPVELPKPTPRSVSYEVVQQRVAICKSCDKYRPAIDTCGICGCGAIVSQRASSIVGKCPSNKWPGESNARSSS